MNKVKISTIYIIIPLLLLLLSACSPMESLPEYKYTFQRIDQLHTDTGITIDGKLDEPVYQNKKYMTFTQDKIKVQVTTHFGDLGLYVGMIITDNMIYYSEQYNMDSNSSISLHVSREDSIKITDDVIELRVDAKYKRAYSYFLFSAATAVQGEALNSGASDGMTTEVFIPWSQLNLDGKPDKVKLMPGYNHVTSTGADVVGTWFRPSGNYNNPLTYYLFNNDGYINCDIDGAIVGDSVTGISKSNGWDLKGLSDENPSIKTNANNAQFIFFREANSNHYLIETTVYPIDDIDDPLPKAGLMIGYNNTAKSAFLIDTREDYLSKNRVSVKVINFFSTWEATDYVYTTYDLDLSQGIKLKVIKENTVFYYYVNDKLVYINEIEYLSGDALPGLFTIGAKVEFTDLKYEDFKEKQTDLQDIISRDAYRIVINNTSGGIVEASKPAIIKSIDSEKMLLDNKITLTILPSIEYKLKKFTIKQDNNEEIDLLDTLKTTLDNGKYNIEVESDIVINSEYSRIGESELTSVTGSISNEDIAVRPTNTLLTIFGKDDKTLLYTPPLRYIAQTKTAEYSINLPSGTYYFRYMLDKHKTQTIEVNVSGKSIQIEKINLMKREIGADIIGKTGDKNWKLISGTNWDFSEEEQSIIKAQDTTHIYLNKELKTKYLIETKISDVTSLNNYDLKAGIIVASYVKNGEIIKYAIMIDQRKVSSQSYVALVKITSKHEWQGHTYNSSINITGDGNELTVVRDGVNIFVYLDNQFISKFTIDYSGEAAFGFQTIGSTATFKDFQYSFDDDGIDELIKY